MGLLGTLMVTVRNEFRSDVLEFDADDPVFGSQLFTDCSRLHDESAFGQLA